MLIAREQSLAGQFLGIAEVILPGGCPRAVGDESRVFRQEGVTTRRGEPFFEARLRDDLAVHFADECGDPVHLLLAVRQARLGLVEDHTTDSLWLDLVGLLISATPPESLDERRDWGIFRDEQVAIQIEGEFADLGRDPQDGITSLPRSPLECGDDIVVSLATVPEFEPAVITEDWRTAACAQPFGPGIGGKLAGQPLGPVDGVDHPQDSQPRSQRRLHLPPSFGDAGDRRDGVTPMVGDLAEGRGAVAEAEAFDD